MATFIWDLGSLAANEMPPSLKNKQTSHGSLSPGGERLSNSPDHLTLKIHFLSFCEHLVASAASCTTRVVMFVTRLQGKR